MVRRDVTEPGWKRGMDASHSAKRPCGLDELSNDELLVIYQKAITACGGPEALAELQQAPTAAAGYARVMACQSGREFMWMDLSAGELALQGRQHRPEGRSS